MNPTDQQLKRYVNALIEPPRGDQAALPPLKIRPTIPASTGVGRIIKQPGLVGSIQSPLTETNAATRQYHADAAVTTTDGVFTWIIKPIKQVDMLDAGDSDVVLIFADPYAPVP